jgi:hypothetical protein
VLEQLEERAQGKGACNEAKNPWLLAAGEHHEGDEGTKRKELGIFPRALRTGDEAQAEGGKDKNEGKEVGLRHVLGKPGKSPGMKGEEGEGGQSEEGTAEKPTEGEGEETGSAQKEQFDGNAVGNAAFHDECTPKGKAQRADEFPVGAGIDPKVVVDGRHGITEVIELPAKDLLVGNEEKLGDYNEGNEEKSDLSRHGREHCVVRAGLASMVGLQLPRSARGSLLPPP